MPFPVSKRKKFKLQNLKELNLIPVLNIFLIMVPFLMYSVVLSRLVSLNLKLPEYGEHEKKIKEDPKHEKISPVILRITQDSLIFQYEEENIRRLPAIALNNDTLLIKVLKEMRKRFNRKEALILKPDENITYENVITLLDRGRYSGFKKISLAY